MGHFLIVTSSKSDHATEVKSNLSLYLEKAHSVIKDDSHAGSYLFKAIITDSSLHKVQRQFPGKGWALLQDSRTVLDFSEYDECAESASDSELLLADCLHHAADSLPYTGAILRVALFDDFDDSCDDEQSEHFIPLAGAVRRLKEWHNGQVVLINKAQKLPTTREILVDFGHCNVVDSLEQVQLNIPNWEGKIAAVDRIEDKGPTFTGHCLYSEVWDKLLRQKVQACLSDTPKPKGLGKRRKPDPPKIPSQPVCGRTIEILQEVDLRTFPLFLVDSWTLNLNVQDDHSPVLMEYVQDLEQVGLLARLRVYSDGRNIPCCGRTNSLNTEAWKKKILGNIYEEPPEKPVTNDVFFMYFLLLRPVCPESSQSIVAQVVLSPREINKSAIETMSKRAVAESDQMKLDLTGFSSDVFVLQNEAFSNLLELLQEHRKNTDSKICDHTKGLDKKDAEKVQQNILEAASEVQDKMITSAFQAGLTLKEYMQEETNRCRANSLHWIAESSLEPEKFPEKMALQAKVAKKTEFKSYPSADSLLGSSPITLEEMEKKRYTTDFDINDILRMFNKDGTPIAPPFTPEKMEGRNLCRVDSTPDLNTQWPNSQSLHYHDIYYYMDENALGLEKKYSKIRDKVLEQDTLCTFVSPIKKRPQKLQKMSPIRSSPRRRNSAQHLMTRSRSESIQSLLVPPHHHMVKNVFKQPSLDLRSPSSRRLSLNLSTPSSASSSSQSLSSSNRRTASSSSRFASQPVSHSTPLSSLPCRVSPRKKVLNRSLSLAGIPSSSATTSRKTDRANLIEKQQASLKKEWSPSMSLKSQRFSMKDKSSQHSSQSPSPSFDPLVRRSPRKSSGMVPTSSKCQDDHRFGERVSKPQISRADCSTEKSSRLSITPSLVDPDESSQQSQSDFQQTKMKRSDRHKMKLKNIIKNVLTEKNVKETDTIYAACFKNLFNVSMVLLKTLSSSQNLIEEMKNVVYGQVQQIINLEKRRCGIAL